jgi:hypothetical protein
VYSSCLFCSANLGSNEAVEIFPVGQRLAFDAANGRLWVVCRRCERWNLTPLEERWEAVERCEELFAGTRLRVSTPNIGLARVTGGLELVRVGTPQRPEMAAWRYGDQFGRRRRRNIVRSAAGLGVLGTLALGGAMTGAGVLLFGGSMLRLGRRIMYGNPSALVARARDAEGKPVRVEREHLQHVRLAPGADGEWTLLVPLRHHLIPITGEEAYRASGSLLPALNRFGGRPADVQRAVHLLGEHDSAHAFLNRIARSSGVLRPQPLAKMTYPTRLAVEMAVHEATERQALEGELAALERAWREAEQIAGIADNLLVPGRITRLLQRL